MKVSKENIDKLNNSKFVQEFYERTKEDTPEWHKKARKYAFVAAGFIGVASGVIDIFWANAPETLTSVLYGISLFIGGMWGYTFTPSNKR